MAKPASQLEPEPESSSEVVETVEVEERPRRGRGRRGARARGARQVREVVTTKTARTVPPELNNVFEKLRGSTSEIELSRYDDRDDMPAFLRNVPSETFSREWVKGLYGGGKYQAIGLNVAGRVVAKADFRIEGAARYPVDPSQQPSSSSTGDTIRPGDAVMAMMANTLTMQTAMTKAMVEMFSLKDKLEPKQRDPVDDFLRINSALRSANGGDENRIGSLAKNMREIAALGAEFGTGQKSLATAVVEAAAPLAESLTEGIKDHIEDRRRARAAAEAEQRTKVIGHIPRTSGEPAPETPTHTTGGEVTRPSLQDQLRDYFLAQLPLLVRKEQLDVDGGDAGVTFYRQLYEITDVKDWPEVQTFAKNQLVIEGLRRELLNAGVTAAWAGAFLAMIVKLIAEPPTEEIEAAEVLEPPAAPSKNGKGKKK